MPQRSHVWYLLAVTAATLLAAALRLPDLGNRPLHGDEAVHAYKLEQLWLHGKYRYDPYEYHGPTLNYLTLPVLWLSGAKAPGDVQAWMLRLVPALAGIALVPLTALLRDAIGRPAVLIAALLTAISPAFAFYSRYYIQEPLLVLFTFLAGASAWRFLRSRRAGWAIACGAGLGLMHATKETCVIAFAALAVGAAAAWVAWRGPRRDAVALDPPPPGSVSIPHGAGLALLAALLVSVAWFTSFGTNWRGPLDSVLTYATYFHRAGERGLHDHPWHYYFGLLLYTQYPRGPAWTEAPIFVLALLGAGSILRPLLQAEFRGGALRRPAMHTIFQAGLSDFATAMTLIYCALPYKTPWCLLGFWHAWILLAGLGGAALLRGAWRSPLPELTCPAAMLLLIAGALLLGERAREACLPRWFSMHNPYVYAHPLRQVEEIETLARRLQRAAPDPAALVARVIHPNPWPLPWYLRTWENAGWWETTPDGALDADLLIVDEKIAAAVTPRLTREYSVTYLGLRPTETLAVLVEWSLHERMLNASSAQSRSR